MAELTRWTVKVSKETDIALRSYLAEHGGKKGDLTRRPRIRALVRAAEAGRLVNRLRTYAEPVRDLPRIHRSDDPADDFLLAMSEAGKADFLATGDKAGLLRLGRHGGTAIVPARDFLTALTLG